MQPLEYLRKVSIYDVMIASLIFLELAAGAYTNNIGNALIAIIAVPLITALIDILIKKALKRTVGIPKSAIISGLFIAGILNPSVPFYVYIIASAVAMLSKNFIRTTRNIFNPAAFGIVSALVLSIVFKFTAVGSWWVTATILTVPLGLFIIYRTRKIYLVLSFIIAYFLVSLLIAKVSFETLTNIAFILQYVFFASFMLLEPMTSPNSKNGIIAGGITAGILAGTLQLVISGVDTVLVSLLVMNLVKEQLDKIGK